MTDRVGGFREKAGGNVGSTSHAPESWGGSVSSASRVEIHNLSLYLLYLSLYFVPVFHCISLYNLSLYLLHLRLNNKPR